MIIFEAWEDENGITFTTQENIVDFRSKSLISTDAKFLYRIEAASYEEAMTQHHIKMEWEPYIPLSKTGESNG
jgi:hypothetical protein